MMFKEVNYSDIGRFFDKNQTEKTMKIRKILIFLDKFNKAYNFVGIDYSKKKNLVKVK